MDFFYICRNMMADKKTERKTALLLLPQHLADDKNILRSIHVTKNEKGVKYDIKDLDALELRKYYHQLPNQAKQGLYWLTQEGLNRLEDDIIKRHKQQKSGVPLRQFLLPAYARKLQEQVAFFKPFANLVMVPPVAKPGNWQCDNGCLFFQYLHTFFKI